MRYSRAATISPCPVIATETPGTPQMCDYCDLIRYVLTKAPTNDYPVCATSTVDAGTPGTCPKCVVYALIHQHLFAQRWDKTHIVVRPNPSAQINPSLNTPHPMKSVTPPQRQRVHSVSDLITRTDSTPTPIYMTVNLVLIHHALAEIHQVLTAIPNSNVHSLQHLIQKGDHHNLFIPTNPWHSQHFSHTTGLCVSRSITSCMI